jgi:hypothetical protein
MSVRQRQAGVDQQAVAVLHQPMPDEAQLRLLAFTLAVETSIGIGGRSMVSFERFWPRKSALALRACRLALAARRAVLGLDAFRQFDCRRARTISEPRRSQ